MSTWHSLPLGKVVTFQRGYDLPHRARKEGAVPIVSSAGVTDYHNLPMVNPPGVVTGRYGTIGEIFFITEPFWPLNTTLYVRNFHGNEPRFVFYLLHRFDFRSFSGKSGVPGVNRNDLHLEPVTLPEDVVEQRAIAAALSDVDALLGGLERLIAKKRDIKQAAMQQLLTGQTRLPGFSGEWEVKRMGDVADVLKGSGLSKSLISASGAHPCIHYGELFTTYGRVISNVVSRTNANEGCRSMAGDVLLPGSTTTTGADLATASALLVEGIALGGDIIIVRRKGRCYDPVFLASYLTHTAKREIAELTQGITIHHLYGKDVKTLSLRLPSLPEQTAIAAVISDMDAELAALEARREKTCVLKAGMMQELLTGKTRLI